MALFLGVSFISATEICYFTVDFLWTLLFPRCNKKHAAKKRRKKKLATYAGNSKEQLVATIRPYYN